ncbi:hypothetical protein ACFIOY_18145 [Bradyrhizobium sp. TZ2]
MRLEPLAAVSQQRRFLLRSCHGNPEIIVTRKSERSLGEPLEELFNRFVIDGIAGDGVASPW